jgi:acetylornithine deacetylase/succinyl-diaminopimelate desuccinylase-like protein
MPAPRPRPAASAALAAALALAPAAGRAQGAARAQPLAPADPARVAAAPAVRRALDLLRATNAATLAEQVSVCEIPAPPFKEQARGAELARRFRALGLRNVRTDAEGNVIAERPGARPDALAVVLSAHLDTVFPEGTDVRVRRDSLPAAADSGGVRLTAPGIGDDCRGLAVLTAVARALDSAGVRTLGPVLFVGTVGEEGPGNLRGVRRLFAETLVGRVGHFISVDGTGLDVTTAAVGSNRYRVTFRGPGGHSYGAFGMPNPAHAMGRAIARIADLRVPAAPRTTFNVGVVSGGQTVNSIPSSATMELDLRSESPAALAALDSAVRAAVAGAVADERARWPGSRAALDADVVDTGRRPAAAPGDATPITRTALAAGRALGFTPRTGASSTDANVPMALGISAVTLDGGGRGVGAHAPAERYEDTARGWLGPQWVALVTVALAGGVAPGGAGGPAR